jgi:hypothetical protein
MLTKRRVWVCLILIGSAVAISVSAILIRGQKPAREIPPVYSIVPTVSVISAKIIEADTPSPRVSVEVRNNSDKAIMAVDLVAGEGAITKNGLTDEDNPIVVIPPYGTTTIEMTFGAMTPGAPLVVSAVTYEDGTDEGDEKSIRAMHMVRKHDRERKLGKQQEVRKQQEGVDKPCGSPSPPL